MTLIPFIGEAQDISGEYEMIYDTSNSYISYKLLLNPDGRFTFHFYRKNDCTTCVEENQYAQGSWESKEKKLVLTADPASDLNEKYTLDLNNSKAHYITKSPRDKSDKLVNTRLKFYQSDIFWVKGIELHRK